MDEKDENKNDNYFKIINKNCISDKNIEKTNTTNNLFFCNQKRKGEKVKYFINS